MDRGAWRAAIHGVTRDLAHTGTRPVKVGTPLHGGHCRLPRLINGIQLRALDMEEAFSDAC